MVSISARTEGLALSKTTAFRYFQIHHAVSIITDEVPLRNRRGVECRTSDHQSMKSSSTTGGRDVDRIQERISCQMVREKGHPVRRWAMVSPVWSHSGQRARCGIPRLSSLSPVQHRSRQASHIKNFTFGGAQVFQFNFQDLDSMAP